EAAFRQSLLALDDDGPCFVAARPKDPSEELDARSRRVGCVYAFDGCARRHRLPREEAAADREPAHDERRRERDADRPVLEAPCWRTGWCFPPAGVVEGRPR